jgi:nickel-dependent lactate racemase
MMKQVDLLYGEKTIGVELPESVLVLEPKPVDAVAEPIETVRKALAKPIASPPLGELARGKKDVCVVISDVTRPVPNRETRSRS